MAHNDKTGVEDNDSVGVRIFRGTGEVEHINVKSEQGTKTSTGNPLEAKLMIAGKLEGKTLVDWQTATWQLLMNAIGQKMLGVGQKRFLFRARLELTEGDPICQQCLCNVPTGCLNEERVNNICSGFVPQKTAIPHLWQWIMQSRILPYEDN